METNNRTSLKSAPGRALLAGVDRISGGAAFLGDFFVVAIAIMLFMEVVLRYVFNAPTVWTQDVSITFQVWFTYLGMAYVLRQRQLIRITAIVVFLGPNGRRFMEFLSLIVILAFSIMAVVMGWEILADSIRLGRRQPSMLSMPSWINELPVMLGFALLAVQAIAELIRLPFQPAPEFSPGGEHSDEEGAL